MAGISKGAEKAINMAVSIGAAVVIFGAWAKILHKSFADTMLTVGLLTEAAIFLIYAVWSLYGYGATTHGDGPTAVSTSSSLLQPLDKMLQEADITPANLKKLSDGFQKLGITVEKMGEIGDMVKATGDYTIKTQEASKALTTMKDAYLNAATSLNTFNEAANGTKQFHEQVQVLTKNLNTLNGIYELELQESNNHLKALNKYYGDLAQASSIMHTSIEDAKKAQDQIGILAKNLFALNQIYGNMLTAMQGHKN